MLFKSKFFCLLFIFSLSSASLVSAVQENIAITNFSGFNILQTDAAEFSDFLRYEFAKRRNLFIIDSEIIEKAKLKKGLSNVDITVQNALDLGRDLSVNTIIVGSVSKFKKLGNYIYISANIIDVNTGNVYVSEDIECADTSEFFEAARTMADSIIRKMGYERPVMNSKDAKKKKKFSGRFNKLGVGIGYPSISILWAGFKSWELEPKFSVGDGVTAIGSRVNIRLKTYERYDVYTGFEYLYFTYETEGLVGTGILAEPYLGAAYYITDRVAMTMDMGPAFVSVVEDSSNRYKISRFGDIIINIGFKFYIT